MKTGNDTPAPQQVTAPQNKTRMDWPDIAKGISILGVVLLHVSLAIPGGQDTLASHLNSLLDPLRMPLFFMVSGFFAVKVLDQSFGELFRGRLWFYLVPYLLWTPVNLYLHRLEGTIFTGREPASFEWYSDSIVWATNMYWFLYFLVMFNLFLWATKKLPGWAIAVLVASLWLFMPAFSEIEILRKSIIYLPAFLIGAYFRPLITRFAESATKPKAIVFSAVLYVAGLALGVISNALRDAQHHGATMLWLMNLRDSYAHALGGNLTGFDMDHLPAMIIRVISLPAGIVMCVWIARIKPLGDLLKLIGKHTLPIYIGHALGLSLIFGFGLRWNFMTIDNLSESMWHHTNTWMVIAFACAMLGGYLTYLLSKVPGLGWSLVPPKLPALVEERPVKVDQPESASASSKAYGI
ncbi:hypothetical protein N24_2255 [Corynebacterium suranareeae]|uniref:Acyltransferase 3 domain-containing protein n=1 Tax=Corynebacterium suranareeae TaxID=2506452 RepID=A0A160PQV0_9CORY|nr:acyltransferase family protein [Corynebacterium suranareeae]BAU96517.1 hypothetical protein N24_2255 [Corynebacterium suranareeae]